MDSNLLTGLIAAGAALLGSLVAQVGPVLQHALSKRHERQVVLRQRYEHMATMAAEMSLHIVHRVDAARRSSEREENQELLRTSTLMHTWATLYFPELIAVIEALRRATLAVDFSLGEGNEAAAKAAMERFTAAKLAATEQIRVHAGRYT